MSGWTNRIALAATVMVGIITLALPAQAARIKDLASIDGVRDNQLIGFGLVGGLAGTGDDPKSAPYTAEAIANMMAGFGFELEPAQLKVKNFAAVMVTADMPAYIRGGDRLDVTVSAIGSAKSLEGGQLYQTLLSGADGQVYAAAQGAVSLGSTVGGGQGGGRGAIKTVGRIPEGALIENTVPSTVLKADGSLRLNLQAPDFTTADAIVTALNGALGAPLAQALDAGSILVSVPAEYQTNLVPFIAKLENLDVQPGTPARVVINQRTGTVVVGQDVVILPVAVSHGELTLTFGKTIETPGVPAEEEAQAADTTAAAAPAAAGALPVPAGGQPAATPAESASVTVAPEAVATDELLRLPTTAEEVAVGLNKMKLAPADIVAIFEAIAAAGALVGELEIL